MIEFLLENPHVHLEVQAEVLALVFTGRMRPADIEPKLDLATAIHHRMPAYLFAA